MGSPKHLWSGDWQDESAAAAARRRATQPTAGSVPADTADTQRHGTRHADATTLPDRHRQNLAAVLRRRTAAWDVRRWALAGGALLAVVLTAGIAVASLGDGGSTPSNHSPQANPPAPPSAQRAPGAGQGAPGAGQGAPGAGAGNPPGSSPSASLAWLGVELQAQHSSAGGVVVAGIVAGGPADAAALRPGDVILGIDNRSVASPQDMINVISSLSPGQTVTIRVLRGSAAFATQATLAVRPSGYPSP